MFVMFSCWLQLYKYMMEDKFEIILTQLTTNSTIAFSIVGFIISFLTFIIYIKKSKLDFKDLKNKESSFSIYLEDSCKINIKTDRVYILFNVQITNHSSSKNSVKPTIEIQYLEYVLKLNHKKSFFDEIPRKDLICLETIINLDEKEMKSGWLIFKYPIEIENKLIKKFTIKIEDGNNRKAQVSSLLIREVAYAV